MTLPLPCLYHWSPRARRKQIIRHGLRPRMVPTISSPFDPDDVDELAFRHAGVCLAPSPSCAWAYSAATRPELTGWWDLWQVVLDDTDEVRIQPHFGPWIVEVRVHNRIPKSRLWWVGEREVAP